VLTAVALLAIGQTAPADALASAHLALSRMPADVRPHVRMLSGYNLTDAEWSRLLPVLNGHVNSLSREPDITRVRVVGARLAAVNLLDYGWDAATWDTIADPFFTALITRDVNIYWRGGLVNGRWYAAGNYVQAQTERALAPWLTETPESRRQLSEVVSWTQSKSPIVRADYFLNQTATAADGRLYYRFLGVANAKDFARAVGSDVDASERFGAVWREAVAFSPVTLHARAFAFTRSLGGYDLRSYDFADNKDGKNPLRVLGKDIEKEAEAVERFAHLANGMWATGIFNGKGEAVATAPDNIASDHTSRSNDKRVHAGISCFRCHADGGLQDVDGWVSSLLRGPLDLRSPDYAKARQLRREYARSLQKVIDDGRRVYEVSVKEATGLGSKEYAAGLAWAFEGYEDARVDLRRSAADLGVTVERWKSALEKAAAAGAGNTVLTPLLVGRELPVRIWADHVAEAHEIVRAAK
jgi:hypothetical protein